MSPVKLLVKKMPQLLGLIMLFSLGFYNLNASPSVSAVVNDICSSDVSEEIKAANGCGNNNTSGNIQQVVINIINAVVLSLGVVAVIFIIVGGVNYMTSAGDSGKLQKAKSTIIYAVVGLIICVLAFAIVNFVITKILR